MRAFAVSIGTAKPTPPWCGSSDSICELTPITRPEASSSGPPAVPGLSTPSVWITLSTENPLGAVSRRCFAATTPVVSVRPDPRGLPIETVGSPTCTARELPSSSGRRSSPSGSTPSSARSVSSSLPSTRAATGRSPGSVTRMSVAPATAWALVRSRPSRSITKAAALATPSSERSERSSEEAADCRERARTSATPGAERS
jgi:hypothetical protein